MNLAPILPYIILYIQKDRVRWDDQCRHYATRDGTRGTIK